MITTTRLIGLLSIAIGLSILLCGVVHATPGEDQALLYMMRMRNMYVGDEGIRNTLRLGMRVCQDREINLSQAEVYQMLHESVPQWNDKDVVWFYGAATTTHCPEYA